MLDGIKPGFGPRDEISDVTVQLSAHARKVISCIVASAKVFLLRSFVVMGSRVGRLPHQAGLVRPISTKATPSHNLTVDSPPEVNIRSFRIKKDVDPSLIHAYRALTWFA